MMRGVAGLFAVIGIASLSGTACSSASGGSAGNGGGANASGTGGGGIGGSGGGLIADSGSGGFGANCAADSYTGELLPLDMYVMLDRSGSMDDSGKWPAVTSAIKQFVALPGIADVGMGLAFFPDVPNPPPPPTCTTNQDCGKDALCIPGFGFCEHLGSCEPTVYAKAIVGMAPLPGVGPSISQAIDAVKPTGGATPSRPALQGAMMYAIDWAKNHTDHVTVVVLATDGEPTGCSPNSVSDVAGVATQGLGSSPSVKTFVIGVGAELTSLDAVAAAGGTDKALIVSGADTGKKFLDALNEIRGAVGCTYKIPVPAGGEKVDFNRVNVAFTPVGGAQEIYPKVDGAAACLGTKSWYYDNPTNPTQIILCPAACDQVENTPGGGKTDVAIGCETVVR